MFLFSFLKNYSCLCHYLFLTVNETINSISIYLYILSLAVVSILYSCRSLIQWNLVSMISIELLWIYPMNHRFRVQLMLLVVHRLQILNKNHRVQIKKKKKKRHFQRQIMLLIDNTIYLYSTIELGHNVFKNDLHFRASLVATF